MKALLRPFSKGLRKKGVKDGGDSEDSEWADLLVKDLDAEDADADDDKELNSEAEAADETYLDSLDEEVDMKESCPLCMLEDIKEGVFTLFKV